MFTLVEIMFALNVYTRRASKMWSVISTFFKKNLNQTHLHQRRAFNFMVFYKQPFPLPDCSSLVLVFLFHLFDMSVNIFFYSTFRLEKEKGEAQLHVDKFVRVRLPGSGKYTCIPLQRIIPFSTIRGGLPKRGLRLSDRISSPQGRIWGLPAIFFCFKKVDTRFFKIEKSFFLIKHIFLCKILVFR